MRWRSRQFHVADASVVRGRWTLWDRQVVVDRSSDDGLTRTRGIGLRLNDVGVEVESAALDTAETYS